MRREIIRKGTRTVCACFVLVLLTYGNAEKYLLVSVMAALVFVLTSIIYAPRPHPLFRVTIVRSLWSANSTALARTLQLLSNVFDPFLHILFYPWQSKHP